MGLVLLAAAVIILMYVRRLKSTKADAYELGHNASLRERLLDAEIDRLRKAWEISEVRGNFGMVLDRFSRYPLYPGTCHTLYSGKVGPCTRMSRNRGNL